MIKINGRKVECSHFPDGTLLLKELLPKSNDKVVLTWLFENNEERLLSLFMSGHFLPLPPVIAILSI